MLPSVQGGQHIGIIMTNANKNNTKQTVMQRPAIGQFD